MSETFSYECERPSDRRVDLRLHGRVAKGDVGTLRDELVTIIKESEAPLDVLLDLTDAEQCGVETRHAFLELQNEIKKARGRTVYVASRPRTRGIALWVIHHADDGRARVMAKLAQGEQWLEGDSERLPELKAKGTRILRLLEGLDR